MEIFKEMIGGGAKIESGFYTGTGAFGSSNPTSLTFNFVPKLVLILDMNVAIGSQYKSFMFPIEELNETYAGYKVFRDWTIDSDLFAKFSGQTLSWYSNASNSFSKQANSTNRYRYFAIG